jgi:hypothetical protein
VAQQAELRGGFILHAGVAGKRPREQNKDSFIPIPRRCGLYAVSAFK